MDSTYDMLVMIESLDVVVFIELLSSYLKCRTLVAFVARLRKPRLHTGQTSLFDALPPNIPNTPLDSKVLKTSKLAHYPALRTSHSSASLAGSNLCNPS